MFPQQGPYVSGWKFIKQKLMYLGLDDNRIIGRRRNKNQIAARYFSTRRSNLGCVLQEVPEIILGPREFDVDASQPFARQRDQPQFLGFHPDYQRAEKYSPEYDTFRNRIASGEFRDRKILFFCFGTIVANKKNVLTLLENLCQVAATKGYAMVIVYPDKAKLSSYISSDRVVFEKVPQLDVLTYADLLITHGGLNSIGEAVQAEVPMLVCTVQPKMDAPKNAERIVRNKLGLQITWNENLSTLAAKIDQVLTDSTFRNNVQHLKSMNDQYSLESFVENMDNIESL
jgi:UDP:flavonoid glycosyltransferase YjiC (YdhE family)